MKDKNKGIALMMLGTFIFLGMMLSPVSVILKLGVGFILALGEAWIVYQLNLFSEEPNQRILEALNGQQEVLNKLVKSIHQQSETLVAHTGQAKEETINSMDKIYNAIEKIAQQGEKVHSQGKEISRVIQESGAQALQGQQQASEKIIQASERIIKEVNGLSTAVMNQERNSQAMLGQVEQVCDEQKKMLVQLMSNYEGINALMQDKQNQVIAAFEKAIGYIEKTQTKNMDELKENIEQHLDELDESIEEHIKEMTKDITKSQKDLSQDLLDKNADLTEGMGKSIDKHLSGIEIAMKEMLKQYEEVKGYISTLQSGLIDLNEKDMEILKGYLK